MRKIFNVHLLIAITKLRRVSLIEFPAQKTHKTNYFNQTRKLSTTNTSNSKKMDDSVYVTALLTIGVHVCSSFVTVDPNMCG